MSHLYPRRRDVRARLQQLHETLRAEAHYELDGELHTTASLVDSGVTIIDIVDYDRDFLTAVRDLMRDGVFLEDAVMAVAFGDEDEAAEAVHGDGLEEADAIYALRVEDAAREYHDRLARHED